MAVELAGVTTLASCLLPRWRQELALAGGVLTPGLIGATSGVAAFTGIVLVLVGRGVAGRRRMAWLAATVALAAATLAHLAAGVDLPAAAVTASAAGILLWQRRLFVVAPSAVQLARVVRITLAVIAVDLCFGVAGLLLHASEVRPPLTPLSALLEVGSRLVGLPGPLTVGGRFGPWFTGSLTALGLLSVVVVVSAVLAPYALPGGSDQELDEARVLAGRADGGTLDPFVLRRDKRRLFSPDHRAVLGYRYVRGVGLASGDPVGDPDAFPAVVGRFLALCTHSGWRPAVVGVRAEVLGVFRVMGLRSLHIGDEALLDVRTFGLAGRARRNARQAVNRSRNAGVTTEILREGSVPPEMADELFGIATTQHGSAREYGFSMALGDLLSGDHPGCLLVVARDAARQPVALQRYVPCRAGTALSLDLMRRLPMAPNGVNERMIVDVVAWSRRHGVGTVSLNFAAFRDVLDAGGSDRRRGQSVEAWLVHRLEGRFGIQMDSLRRFNAKFGPTWVPRYLVYRSRADLPAVGLAALSAEGFLPLDPGREGRAG
ncbi:phosphatidylglycerol lysyltransferase domain-containing protein [Actinoplanes sp. NPDC049316]|uniref:bifunctional lysylphosphatidylglycerol flippase/synthetase MprF n=1 Tax=Actinoplanes sp. NPDC049316 TaxID=3154727 RepID=UPI0034354727